ncbi:MAG: glycosyltransferase family 4 protein [Terracidiphilus sp.]|jgi:glycosyltransferase involved in cell wall biosynthesis
MKVLVVHNKYQFTGGEDAAVHDEIELLRRRGHCVEWLEQNNDAIHDIRGKLIASSSVFYSASARRRMSRLIQEFRPDVVHVHNWFSMLSPSIVIEADTSGVPVVQTLHNFRMLCANALLYRNGVVCTDCLGKSFPMDGMVHGCYRGSHAGSAVVTAAYAFHRFIHTWDRVDLFIAVSSFEREILIRGGLPSEKVVVKTNFCDFRVAQTDDLTEDFALYVGRLSPEKGIRTLLLAWKQGRVPIRLKIIGDGPLAEEVGACAAANTNIEYLGLQPADAVCQEMAKAKFLVFPSEWFETFGRTIIEAFSQGTPVLAADLGSARELVSEGLTGYFFPPGDVDALAAGALRFGAGEGYKQMRVNCRSLFLSRFTAEINYARLMEIYAQAIAMRRQRRADAGSRS